MATARYDGHAEWYEVFSGSEGHERARSTAIGLVGHGPGRCLDLGTGTGRAIPALIDADWAVVAVDVSRDQLDVARARSGPSVELVAGDAHRLPFTDEAFDAVLSCFTHTDFDDVFSVFNEVARVLAPHGRFVYVGPHPCFGSPFIAREAARDVPDAVALVRAGYREAGWSQTSFNPEGIRSRVGINHRPSPISSTQSSTPASPSPDCSSPTTTTRPSSWDSSPRSQELFTLRRPAPKRK